jgi:hypothetical protein
MLGEKVGGAIINKLLANATGKDPNSLDNMDLDRRDYDNQYDPFF